MDMIDQQLVQAGHNYNELQEYSVQQVIRCINAIEALNENQAEASRPAEPEKRLMSNAELAGFLGG